MPSSHTGREEKSPLLPPESPDERYNIPEDVRVHNRAVYQGVALLVKRWPDHVSSGWTPVIYVAFFSFILTLIFLSSMMVLSKMKFSAHFHLQVGRNSLLKNETLLDFDISCEVGTLSTTRFPEQLSHPKFPYHLQQQRLTHLVDPSPNSSDNTEPLRRAFFTSIEEDVTSARLCSVESAAKLLPNTTVYLILLHSDIPEPSELFLFVERLQAIYENLRVYRIATKRYFTGSSLSEIFENASASNILSPSMIEFAARVLTLWRYGGVIVDSQVAVHNGTLFPGRGDATDDEVVLTETGSVISAGYQCQELLFQIMSTLVKLSNNPEELHTTIRDVVSLAVKKFCVNQTILKSDAGVTFHTCPGVSVLSSELVCKSDEAKDTCLWKSVNGMLPIQKQNLCPLTLEHSPLT